MPTPPHPPTVLARIGGFILDAAQARGVELPVLLARTGFDPAVLDEADARMALAQEDALWDTAAELAGDAGFGLWAATRIRPGAFDALDYAVRTAPDLLSALQRLARYNRLVHDLASFRVIDEGTRVAVEHGFAAPGQAPGWQASDFTLASLPVVASQMLGQRVAALAVEVAHAAPIDARPYVQAFGVTPRFDAPVSKLVFDAALLRRPLPNADPGLSRIVTAHADRLLAERAPGGIDGGVVAQVGQLIGERIANGPPSLGEIARALHTSERGLQRQLEAQGTRFSELVDRVRHELALRYLADRRLALGEVAYLLGYAEPSPFHRAFKRWTGRTPAAARRESPRRH
ncbi:AraC family transcriptional regulator [Hydrogenophaga sp. PML113]|uniref:AraC family transcriptional regulator n=1 Tax=Hydrogenophaga sp. PML113 TaxID=1899350 RepID=UPI000878C6FD|nr:AraC family transcriptional regulator [Hydrogenophaga sp. PML113]